MEHNEWIYGALLSKGERAIHSHFQFKLRLQFHLPFEVPNGKRRLVAIKVPTRPAWSYFNHLLALLSPLLSEF